MKECYGGKEKDCGQGGNVFYRNNKNEKNKKEFHKYTDKLDRELNLYITRKKINLVSSMRGEFDILFSFNWI